MMINKYINCFFISFSLIRVGRNFLFAMGTRINSNLIDRHLPTMPVVWLLCMVCRRTTHTDIKKAQTSVDYSLTEAFALPTKSNKQQEAYADMTHTTGYKTTKGHNTDVFTCSMKSHTKQASIATLILTWLKSCEVFWSSNAKRQ